MNDEEFRKYTSPFTRRVFIITIIVALFTAMMIAVMGIPAAGLLVLYGLFLLISYRNYRKFLDKLIQHGNLEAVASDFASSRPWLDKKIRTGKQYLFCQGQPVLYTYPELLNLYEQDSSVEFFTFSKCLCAVIQGGRRVALCSLKTTLKQNPEAMELLRYLLTRNPSLTFGYKNSLALTKKRK